MIQYIISFLVTWSTSRYTNDKRRYDELSGKPNLFEVTVFYTAPPKREWVSLTDEEVSDVIDDVLEGGGWLDVARALEAAIKNKNKW